MADASDLPGAPKVPDVPSTPAPLAEPVLSVPASTRPRLSAAFEHARQWWRKGLALAEKRCPACHAPYVPVYDAFLQDRLCPNCAAQLKPYSAAHCPLCGLPQQDPHSPSVPCAQCLNQKPPWSQLAFYALYDGLLQSLLLRLKFHGDFSLVPTLGAMLCQACASLPPYELVLAVPQHPDHLRERGFNQAHEFAKIVAKTVAKTPAHTNAVPLSPHALVRTRSTPPQTRLNAQQRKDNPKDSFAAHKVANAHVLLLDDTMTTGATLRHATLALLAGGAASVSVAVVARTPHEGGGKAHDNHHFFV